jgi:hypothetical protein
MNHKITQVLVPTSLNTSATTDALATQAVAFYDGKLTTNLGATPSATEGYVVIGSGSSKYGSFKSGLIVKSNILRYTKTIADTNVKQQITYLGFDEVNDFKTPIMSCDEEFVVTLKIDEYWSKGIYQPMIQDSVRVKTPCCADCAGGCDATDSYAVMASISSKINANPLLSKYVTASVVYKGTAPAYKYTLTLPDSFTSGAAATYITSTLQPYYPSATYGTITVTADTDGSDDANTTGNTMFEIATPVILNVADMPLFNGIAWESVLTTVSSVTAAGVKITGNALDEFGNACVPDAVPYVFNLVRFKVAVHEGPYNTQDFDIEDWCGPWAFTKTQDIKYPIGAGAAIAEMERHFFGNNLPATAEARRYWNPIYNNDSDVFLFVDKTKTYNMYEVTYRDSSPAGFEKKSTDNLSVVFLIDSSASSLITNFEAALNAFTGLTPVVG